MVYSFRSDKKSDYLSHTYMLDKHNTGTEIVLDSNGMMIAQLPIYHGRVHGCGYFFDGTNAKGQTWHFYHDEPLSPYTNYPADPTNDFKEKLEISANLSGLFKENLLKKRPAQYIFNRKEKEMIYTFKPVAQNTTIRPLAEAVCMMHGGEDTSYIDPTDKKEKCITYDRLHSIIGLEVVVNGQNRRIDGNLIAFQTRHNPDAKMHVEINDVVVNVTPTTTVQKAMAQFKRKYLQNNKINLRLANRQRS